MSVRIRRFFVMRSPQSRKRRKNSSAQLKNGRNSIQFKRKIFAQFYNFERKISCNFTSLNKRLSAAKRLETKTLTT